MEQNILSISLKEYKSEIDSLRASLLSLEKGSEAYQKTVNDIKAKQQQLNEVMAIGKKDTDALEGSYNALQQQMTALKKEWRATNDEAKRNELGKQINEMDAELKELDATIGQFQRSVGNYAIAGKSMSATIKENEAALAAMEDTTTEAYKKLFDETAKLYDKRADLKQAIKNEADDAKALNTIIDVAKLGTAAFGVWQSAAAMFGVENEKVVESIQKLQVATTMLSSLKEIQLALFDKGSRIYQLYTKTLQWVTGAEKANTASVKANAGAMTANAAATTAASTALKVFRGALVATGIGVFVALLSALISNWDKLTAAIKRGTSSVKDYTKEIAEADKKSRELYVSTLTTAITNFNRLKAEWNSLKSTAEKTKWIENNKSEFEQLGIKVNDVKDAERAFVNETEAVIESLKNRAKAAAMAAKAQELYSLALENSLKQTELVKEYDKKKKDAKDTSIYVQGSTMFGGGKTVQDTAEDKRNRLEREKQQKLNELKKQQNELEAEADKLIEDSVKLTGVKIKQEEKHVSTKQKSVDTEKQELKVLSDAADLESKIIDTDAETKRNQAQLDRAKGLITERQLAERLLEIDKEREHELDGLALKYGNIPIIREKYELLASQACWKNEITEAKLATDKISEQLKTDFDNTVKDIRSRVDSESANVEHASNMASINMTGDDNPFTKQKSVAEQLIELEMQTQQRLFDIREKGRQDEKSAIATHYGKLIAQVAGNNEEIERLTKERDGKLAEIDTQSNGDRMQLEETFAQGQKDLQKAEQQSLQAWANKTQKTISDYASSISGLMSSIGDIMENNIKQRVENGEISQEEAEKEFERVKGMQIAITWLNTLAGAAGGLLQGIANYPPPYGAIIGGIAAATAMATGVAQTQQIKNSKFGEGGSGGSAGGGAATVPEISVAPLLNEELDAQSMTALNTEAIANGQGEQRVWISQHDLTKSDKQVQIRQADTTF